jgi:hypothetical protein
LRFPVGRLPDPARTPLDRLLVLEPPPLLSLVSIPPKRRDERKASGLSKHNRHAGLRAGSLGTRMGMGMGMGMGIVWKHDSRGLHV